ncbi:uncharacterized protein LOC110463246 [Mizuhopecten yessoensis]|uniref:Peroxidasin-like protein n=1 Tax=Mizuhopecten yessoensis TaxID=6573 RepID=A0A210PWM5_MIZYE|nr:uncharacterized protein LOC110463246 [Mizuhopecten yessoensis]OWF40866.1 Peroxidasin-like protein [Mizuhopecten yessoensis]
MYPLYVLCTVLLVFSGGHTVTGFSGCTDTDGPAVAFKHNETWNKSTDNCQTCICNDGTITCSRLRCPSARELTCAEPKLKNALACCKTCDDHGTRDKEKNLKKVCFKDIRKDHRRKHKKMRGRRRGRSKRDLYQDAIAHKHRHHHSDSDVAAMPAVLRNRPVYNRTRIPRFLRHMCVPKRADHLVYRHIEGKELFVAFDNAKKDEVELWKWQIGKTACESLSNPETHDRCRDGSQDIHLNMSTFRILIYKDTKVFRKQMTKSMVLGAASKNQVDNFKNKLLKTMDCGGKKRKCMKEGLSPELCQKKECTHRVVMIMRAFYKDIRLFSVNFDCAKCNRANPQRTPINSPSIR